MACVRSLASYRFALLAGAGGSIVMAVLWAAVAADVSKSRGGLGATMVDIGVGLVFVVVAPFARRGVSFGHQLLVGTVGVAWLAGSTVPLARSWHQAALVLAVALFPTGLLRGPRDLVAVATALVVATGALSQGGAALAFLLVALMAARDRRHERSARAWPTLTAAGLAAVLGTAWAAGRVRGAALEPALVLGVYESLLVVVALGYVMAARSVGLTKVRITESMVGAGQLTGLGGLTAELRRAVGDPELQIHPWSSPHRAYLDETGRPLVLGNGSAPGLTVAEGDRPLAVVVHRGTALDDPATAEAVRSAVRLTLTHQRLQEEQRARLVQLHAARTRLVAAADLERDQLREELRASVLAPIEAARRHVGAAAGLAQYPEEPVTEALEVAIGQLSTAGAEVRELTAGVPAIGLGDGRLLASLTALAEGSPVPVVLRLEPDARADRQGETALYYVCSEALANVAKHAGATRVTVTLRRATPGVELIVADDGRGGARPTGSGLAGLGDRVAARGGRLRVDSPPGAGTVITATLPG
jgi:signal transduction histidine kinase